MIDPLKPMVNDAPIFLDFEASSLRGYPVQVAYGSDESNVTCMLIKPLPVWLAEPELWDYNAEAVHGFSQAYLHQHGLDAVTVAKTLTDDLAGKVVFADSGLDSFWLSLLLSDAAALAKCEFQQPRFLLIDQLIASLNPLPARALVQQAQAQASALFKAKGLVPHQADNDVLKHIWAWQSLQRLINI